MTDGEFDEERDPLLVRPYLRGDADAGDGDASTQTWPSATTREVRSQRALEGADDPTAVLFLPEKPPRHLRDRGVLRRHRALVLIAACALVLIGAAAAAVANLRADGRPSASSTLPEAPIPALTGLVPSLKPSATPAASSPVPSKSVPRSASVAATATSEKAASARPSVTAGAGGEDGKTVIAPGDAVAPEPPAAARTGTIRGQNGLCLDLNGAVPIDFNHVQVFECNGSVAQTWTLATDGTLRVQGLCALVLGDNTVHVVGCDGRTTAQWRASGQLLINASNDKCLTDPSGGATSGTGVTVTTCDGRANERWSLP
ncbi:ricin-type beta-trefoil lectin domain protein [Actinoplanes sp. NPDC026619]|uniref:ricin-type beta-trefoil lectin domain protein n=1 Tax=Actinoplanes sp. NPDC026619 TaxID=3155798 RepID=UPI0033D415AF